MPKVMIVEPFWSDDNIFLNIFGLTESLKMGMALKEMATRDQGWVAQKLINANPRLFTVPLFFRGIVETGTLDGAAAILVCKSERDLGRVSKLPRGGVGSWEAAGKIGRL